MENLLKFIPTSLFILSIESGLEFIEREKINALQDNAYVRPENQLDL